MRIQHVHTAIDAVISAARKGRYLALFLHGHPGSAKSALVRAAARRNRMQFMDLRLSIHEPVDLTGVPTIRDGKTLFCAPAWLPTDGEGILFQILIRSQGLFHFPLLEQQLGALLVQLHALARQVAVAVEDGRHREQQRGTRRGAAARRRSGRARGEGPAARELKKE